MQRDLRSSQKAQDRIIDLFGMIPERFGIYFFCPGTAHFYKQPCSFYGKRSPEMSGSCLSRQVLHLLANRHICSLSHKSPYEDFTCFPVSFQEFGEVQKCSKSVVC